VLFPLYKNSWAKSTIKRVLVSFYREKEKFSDKEIEELNSMMDEINNKLGSEMSRESVLNMKIKSNAAESNNPVVDGRGSRLVVDGLGAWTTRQFGL